MYKEIEGIDSSTYAGKAALAVKTKARGIFGDGLLTFKLIDFITFMQLNTNLMLKGIFITDENREEKYIEIIESGDEKLINELEKYIELLDSLKILQNKKEEYDSIIEKLRTLSDYNNEKNVNEIIENYLRR